MAKIIIEFDVEKKAILSFKGEGIENPIEVLGALNACQSSIIKDMTPKPKIEIAKKKIITGVN